VLSFLFVAPNIIHPHIIRIHIIHYPCEGRDLLNQFRLIYKIPACAGMTIGLAKKQ
jgi:hypothetical protein